MKQREDFYPFNATLEAIAAEERRTIVTVLLEEASSVAERDFVDRLLTDGVSAVPPRAPNPEIQTVRLDLVHHHLPMLADAGLIRWDRDARTAERGSHPALDDPRFRSLLTIDTQNVDAALSGLSHDHRRIALTVLKDAPASLTTTDLAREIHRQASEVTGRRPASIDDLLVSLHHGHLPKLAAADFIEYDRETSRATYSDHPALERVFSVVFASDERTADRYDAFLEGLHDSYEEVSRDAGEVCLWPHFWRDPSHG